MKRIIQLLLLLAVVSCSSENNSINTSTFQISANVSAGGSITPFSTSVKEGDSVTFKLNADEGFEVESVIGCNGIIDGSFYTTGPVSSDCNIDVNFSEINFTITTKSSSEGGQLSPQSLVTQFAHKAAFTIEIFDGYDLESINGCDGSLTGNTYTVDPVTENCEIIVNFAKEVDNSPPSINVTFPMANFRIDKNQTEVFIKGTATDESPITSITINGVKADVLALQNTSNHKQYLTATRTEKNALNQRKFKYDWQARIPTSSYTGKITVSSEDEFSNIGKKNINASLVNYQVPMNFTLDNEKKRLIGSNHFNKLIIIDLSTRNYRYVTPKNMEYANHIDSNTEFAYLNQQNAVVYVTPHENEVVLSSLDLTTGDVSILYRYAIPNYSQFQTIDYSEETNTVYVNLMYFSSSSTLNGHSTVFQFDLTSGQATTIVSGLTSSGVKVETTDMRYTTDGLIGFTSGNGLSRLDFSGNDYDKLLGHSEYNSTLLEIDKNTNTVYMAGSHGISKFNLETNLESAVSLNSDSEEFRFGHISNIKNFSSENQLLVGDYSLDVITSVDKFSGERALFLSRGIGAGPILKGVRAITYDPEQNTAFVLDDDSSPANSDSIVAIDLKTGIRSSIANIGEFHNRGSFLFDLVKDNNHLYAFTEEGVVFINTNTKETRLLSGIGQASGVDFSFPNSATLDKANNRLIVADSTLQALISIDLETGNRALLKDLSNISNQNSSLELISVALDALNDKVFVLTHGTGELHSVSLENGTTNLILQECLAPDLTDRLNRTSGSGGMYFNQNTRQLLIKSESLLMYDVDKERCTASNSRKHHFDFVLTDSLQILSSGNNRVTQQDFESGEQIILSK